MMPAPARCAHRPTLSGGMVVPYVAIQGHQGAAVLGGLDDARVAQCIAEGLCQVCGQRLALPYVVLVRESDTADRYSSEPAVHPECAAYAVRVCPMLNGQQDRYVTTAGRVERAGWTVTDIPDGGRQVERWSAVWLDQWYAVTLDERRRVSGLSWADPVRVRPVPSGAEQ